MKKIISICVVMLGIFFTTYAQQDTAAYVPQSPSSLKGNARKVFLDSTLKHAGATLQQIQRFDSVKAAANTKMKAAKKDTVLGPQQKQDRFKQINDEKNAAYRSILGTDVYKTYNNLKNIKIQQQKVVASRPSELSIVKDCLDSVNASASQKQQFLEAKRLYREKMKTLYTSDSLTSVQKKQQSDLLKQEKNSKYLQILGQQKYSAYNLARRRRSEVEGL